MNLLPKSIQGRLALVFLSCLAAILGVSLLVFRNENNRALDRRTLLHQFEQINTIVAELDNKSEEDRRELIRYLRLGGLSVRLVRMPAPEPGVSHPIESLLDPGEFLLPGHPWKIFNLPQRNNTPDAGFGDGLPPGPPPPLDGATLPWKRSYLEVQLEGGGWVQVALRPPRAPEGLPERFWIFILVTFGTTFAFSWVAVRYVTRPLRELAHAARRFSTDLDARPLALKAPSEAADAAAAFNAMQERIKSLIEERTRALAAMSHDLRTPLTRMRLRLEMMEDEPWKDKTLKDVLEMHQMVEATLDYMRGLKLNSAPKPVQIQSLVESLVADIGEVQPGRIAVRGGCTRTLVARPTLLRRALQNLVDNALKYAPSAEVVLEEKPDGILLAVDDTGPGLPEEALEKVKQPWVRQEDSRNKETGGMGLGLTIASDIAALHGGRLELSNRLGGGLRAALWLPWLWDTPLSGHSSLPQAKGVKK